MFHEKTADHNQEEKIAPNKWNTEGVTAGLGKVPGRVLRAAVMGGGSHGVEMLKDLFPL